MSGVPIVTLCAWPAVWTREAIEFLAADMDNEELGQRPAKH